MLRPLRWWSIQADGDAARWSSRVPATDAAVGLVDVEGGGVAGA